MTKTSPHSKTNAPATRPATIRSAQDDFDEVVALIGAARTRAVASVNTALIDLYWSIGDYISRKIAADGWGQGTVAALADYIQRQQPNARGFSASNLWRMMQFFETYRRQPKLATLLRVLSWSHNLAIMSRSKRQEEREFYLRMASRERWSLRQLQRQLSGALFERVALSPVKLSTSLTTLHPAATAAFKDSYLIEFLSLPKDHSEADLHDGLVAKLKDFLIELGRDFCFVGSHYPIQVGGRDFEIDLLFFHRGLNCLVDIELKIDEFQAEYLGKLEFYLEALDRDVKKNHENPAIGLLLCATKDREVVEYALSRSASPALVAEYQTRLPDKNLLQAKLHEFYESAQEQNAAPAAGSPLLASKKTKPSKARPAKGKKRYPRGGKK